MRGYAEKIVAWLAPYCERVAIAGSVRRQRPMCGDVDLVVIPKVTEYPDMLGVVVSRENHLHRYLQDYIQERNPFGNRHGESRWVSGGEKEGKQCILELKKCQLDLWFADATTWATRLLCRTGSAQHNIYLAARAQDRGLKWQPYDGLCPSAGGAPLTTPTEQDLYAALGLSYIEPPDREADWIGRHLEFGL